MFFDGNLNFKYKDMNTLDLIYFILAPISIITWGVSQILRIKWANDRRKQLDEVFKNLNGVKKCEPPAKHN